MSIFYPDNDNRERRMTELIADVNTQIVNSTEDQNKIDTAIKDLDAVVRKMLLALEPGTVLKVDTIDLYKTTWTVANIVTPALTFKAAYSVLTKVAANRLLQNAAARAAPEVELAEIAGEEPIVAEAAEEVGLPLSARIASGVGGAVVAVGVGFAVDAIDGSVARDKMRDKIHELAPVRVKSKVAEIQFRTLFEEVNSLVATYHTMEELGYTRDQVDRAISLTIDKFKPQLEAIDESKAKAELAEIDQSRGSWTNEDD